MAQIETAMITGRNPSVLANAISDAIAAALASGMEMDEAVSVSVAVAADHGIAAYGPAYASMLFVVLEDRTTRALAASAEQQR